VIALFILAGLAPLIVAFGLLLWRRYIAAEADAASLVTPTAIGLTAGVLLGGGVGGLLVLGVWAVSRHAR
jgi:hypothetical protein